MTIVSFREDELPEITPEQEAEIKALAEMPDSEIDFSDIPKLTEERFARMRPFREVMSERRALKKQTASVQ
jgi:hypothetical protein